MLGGYFQHNLSLLCASYKLQIKSAFLYSPPAMHRAASLPAPVMRGEGERIEMAAHSIVFAGESALEHIFKQIFPTKCLWSWWFSHQDFPPSQTWHFWRWCDDKLSKVIIDYFQINAGKEEDFPTLADNAQLGVVKRSALTNKLRFGADNKDKITNRVEQIYLAFYLI